MNKEQLLEAIKAMTVLELNEFLKACEEEFGVSTAAPVAVAGAAVCGEASAGAAEEKLNSMYLWNHLATRRST